ncbi:hypothetical protein BO221_02615 [Archangium sp. Cb G35]|uniref:phospholipase D-like domain-containing protein n=1 Tax=Archangium sp. Cb G35 TaxID=1920190 RepID=UPI000937C153|nr:phospholipase D-like domain-containing protein [Archangium sp. Cb G35]OJT26922.1 hypothetical protein BO221_02615 [Archangium sp. Cb G35]
MSKVAEKPVPSEGVEVVGKTHTILRLHDLLDEAQKWVTLVSPYLAIEKLRDVERKIRNALSRKVTVTLVIRARDAHQNSGPSTKGLDMIRRLVEQGLKVYEVPDLHAKVYVSERHALVTSLNLLESSFNNSIEIGIWVPAGRTEYGKILEFVRKEVAPHGRPLSMPAPEEEDDDNPFFEDEELGETGHCIRCGETLELNPSKPYCAEHYAVWARYSNPDYRDSFCHGCGDEYPATKNKPFCRDCFDEYDGGIPF